MSKENNQGFLFDVPEGWEEEWQGMPGFVQEDQSPFKTIYVHFENRQDINKFAKLVGQTITIKTKSIWYPKAKIERYIDKQYIDIEEQEE